MALCVSLLASTTHSIIGDILEIQNCPAFAEQEVKCCDEACGLLTGLI